MGLSSLRADLPQYDYNEFFWGLPNRQFVLSTTLIAINKIVCHKQFLPRSKHLWTNLRNFILGTSSMVMDVYGGVKGNLYNKGRRVSYRYFQAEIGLR